MKKWLGLLFFMAGAISILVMSLDYFQSDNAGILRNKPVKETLWYLVIFRLHIFFGIIAIGTGPFQLITQLRNRFMKGHRRLGYTYSISVGFSSTCGLLVAPYAMGGMVSAIGFSILAVIWGITNVLAIQAILRKDLKAHSKWMYLNYGITFAAITQRTMLLLAIFGVSFIPLYQLSAWIPWMINLTIAYILYYVHFGRSSQKPNEEKP